MKNEPKKIISLRYYLFKMYNEGYTQEQMQEFVKKALNDGKVTLDDIIEALVISRFDELVAKKRINGVLDALKGY